MRSKSWTQRQRLGVVAAFMVACIAMMSACSSGPQFVQHSFEFDALHESPEVEVLDYRYGSSKHPGARPEPWELARGRVSQQAGIHGDMRRGDDLYVKWRIKATGEILEDTVDLKGKLPSSIKDHRIHFVVKGRQLFVYLVTPQRNPPGWPTYDPPGYTHLKTYQLYPNPEVKQVK